MVSFGNVAMSNRVNATAVYHAAGYTSFYNFITQDLEELYTSDGLEFMVGDPDSYQDTPYVEITAPSGAEIISFYTPSAYVQSDVYRVNGVECPVVNLQNMQFDEGWAAGVPVTLYLIDEKLWWPLGGGNLTELPPEPDPILANNSWEMIIDTANKGKGQDYWNIGDKINIQVGDELLEFAIMDFNHDDKSDGSGKANITFGMTGLMTDRHAMNSTATNVGSFVGSEMYAYLKDTVLPSIPQEVQNAIKPVNKRTSAGNKSTEIQTDSISIWLFSAIEVGLSARYVSSNEGTAYPYHTSTTRQKGYNWWLRSPSTRSTTNFCSIYRSGTLGNDDAYSSYGVSFGFCV